MRGAHHDAVLISQFGVERVVLVKGVIPHRWPEVVPFQAENEFEDLGVELVIVVSVFLLNPTGERRRLVVEKDPSVFHLRWPLNVGPGSYEQGFMTMNGHICPPIPGGNTNLLGKIVDAVNRAAFVAAENDQSRCDAWQRLFDNLNEERFPLAGDCRHVNFVVPDQLIDGCALAQRADEDDLRWEMPNIVRERRLAPSDTLDVGS